MTVEFQKTITVELTPSQYALLLELQADETKLPQLARELISQALRDGMDSMPGRKTKPVQGGAHDSN